MYLAKIQINLGSGWIDYIPYGDQLQTFNIGVVLCGNPNVKGVRLVHAELVEVREELLKDELTPQPEAAN